MAFAHAIGSYPYWCVVMFLCERAQTPNAITKRKSQTQVPNASTKRKSQTLPVNATSNGGDASRVGHKSKGSYTQ